MPRLLVAVSVALLATAALAKDRFRPAAEDSRKASAECAYIGPGYVKAPGSDTCVKIGGSVRVEGQARWPR